MVVIGTKTTPVFCNKFYSQCFGEYRLQAWNETEIIKLFKFMYPGNYFASGVYELLPFRSGEFTLILEFFNKKDEIAWVLKWL